MALKTLSGRRASQDEWELRSLISLFKEHGVRSYLEIGARHGDTFYDIVRGLPLGSKAVAVDLGGGAWGTPKSVAFLETAVGALVRQGYDASTIFGDSTSEEVQSAVREHGPYDAVLIDGDHRLAGVTADWVSYGTSKIVAFHDIAGVGQTTKDGSSLPVEVPVLWEELKAKHRHIEFIAPGSTMGIGVILQ